ncbi:putative zinc metalloproteinase [Acanthamoeba polyphaga mimivirus]|uniref:Zinc metalloproteinase n=1 Tax=Acanthamoeba polyphaga mimivirus Kroon TaxID=3069720 RepID=A0A0G2Y8T3_9VIRU|nr:putative zinc metalloproteinase [Acanthamoeba polyphaga mimivirus]AKI80252.1 putative zinc metalloproteinase [Acanthamoeba polyphaga mimivirus Kroon]
MTYRSCIPQNDLECYYNPKKTKDKSINILSSIQHKIDKELIAYITDKTIGDTFGNRMIVFRDSFYDKPKNSKTLRQIIHIIETSNCWYSVKFLMDNGVSSLFSLGITPHHTYPKKYYPMIISPILSLESKNDYQDYLALIRLKNFIGYSYDYITTYWNYKSSNRQNFINDIIEMETQLSLVTLTIEQQNNPFVIYNSLKWREFLEKYDVDNFWLSILGSYLKKEDYIIFDNIQYLLYLREYLKNTSKNSIKNYLVYSLVKKFGLYTDLLEFYNDIVIESINHDQIFLNMFSQYFGIYLETVFEIRYHNKDKKEYITKMFYDMKSYLRNYFIECKFTDKTKREISLKIDNLDIVIGRQNYQYDLEKFPPMGNDFYENILKLEKYYFHESIKLIGSTINREWFSINGGMYSFEVNAYYDPICNVLYIPTSIINDMTISLQRDDVYNYGSIGTILAHEIMHSLDNFGLQVNCDLSIGNKWNTSDYKLYLSDLRKIIQHRIKLSNYDIASSIDALSEDISDTLGLKLSFKTYLSKFNKKIEPWNLSTNDKIHLQKFFYAWTETFKNLNNNNQDDHSPSYIRINAPLAHLDEFYYLYDVESQHLNYLDPQLRSRILDKIN